MSARPLVIDAFCCAGGSAMGWYRAGFRPIGVDVKPQPRYPFEFIQGDVFEVVPLLLRTHTVALLTGSPPCQGYSDTQQIRDNDHPMLIAPFRDLCQDAGLPYVIENVEGARSHMRSPVTLCGSMFGLRTNRHRLFESDVPLVTPEHDRCWPKTVKMGRPLREGDVYHAVGNFSNVDYVRRDMGVGWMNRDEIRECIPPVYTAYLGTQIGWAL